MATIHQYGIDGHGQQLRDVPRTFSTEYDSMTEDQKGGITPQSFEWPTKPE